MHWNVGSNGEGRTDFADTQIVERLLQLYEKVATPDWTHLTQS